MILVWNLEWHSNQNTYWISGSSVDGWQNSGFVNVNFSPLMQYVGRQDKNGKNVFCGDYVKAMYQHDGANNYDYEIQGEVKFDEERLQWCIEVDKGGEVWTYPFCSFEQEELIEDTVEIIGNIYENPDLI